MPEHPTIITARQSSQYLDMIPPPSRGKSSGIPCGRGAAAPSLAGLTDNTRRGKTALRPY